MMMIVNHQKVRLLNPTCPDPLYGALSYHPASVEEEDRHPAPTYVPAISALKPSTTTAG